MRYRYVGNLQLNTVKNAFKDVIEALGFIFSFNSYILEEGYPYKGFSIIILNREWYWNNAPKEWDEYDL